MKVETHYTVSDLYKSLELPLTQWMDFTIHFLPTFHQKLPFYSGIFRSDYFSFIFIKNGSGIYTVDDQEFVVEPNTIYFTNPGHLKSFRIDTCEDAYLITFSENFLRENIHPTIFDEFPFLLAEIIPPSTFSPKEFASFERIYLTLFSEFQENSELAEKIIGNLFISLLLKCKEKAWKSDQFKNSNDSTILGHFKKLLEFEFKKVIDPKQSYVPLNVQDYASKLNLHPNYFNTVIKNKSGKTANDWIRERTLSAAKSLLKNTALNSKEIAFQLGFSEQTHFSRFFKREHGCSPSDYKKQKGV